MLPPMTLTHRLATEQDLAALDALMARAIAELQHGLLSPAQIAVSHQTMGLDRQLVTDRTYFIALSNGKIAGCGGWSWRTTLFGGDASIIARDPRRLDPATEPAKVRAMYTDPAHARKGVGAYVLALCEDAARAAGFARVELMATLSGARLYRKAGYVVAEELESAAVDGITVPLLRMEKPL